MKKQNNEKKPMIKTRTRLDGGKEVEITKSPSQTKSGKFMALLLAVLTVGVTVLGLVLLMIQAAK